MCTERTVATAVLERVSVASNEPVGPELREIVLVAPQTAASIKGGQFVHLVEGAHEPLMVRSDYILI